MTDLNDAATETIIYSRRKCTVDKIWGVKYLCSADNEHSCIAMNDSANKLYLLWGY